MIRLAHTEFLWALLLIPLCVVIYFAYHQWRQRALKSVADPHLLNVLLPTLSQRKPLLRLILMSSALLLLVLGIAGPQIGTRLEEGKREGIDLMICLDVSNSMLAEDLAPNRLKRAKRAMEKLVDRLRSDRIGMVVFAGKAFVQLPITTDYAAAKLFLQSVNTQTVTVQGTALGSAIELALESFDEHSTTSKAIIVITDGENHEDDALAAVQMAKSQGVVVHTIGMGSEEGAPIPVYSGRQRIGFRSDASGSTVITQLDPDMLQELATAGGGKFIRATQADAGLDALFDEIESMEKATFGTKIYTDYEDRFQYFAGAALLLLILETLMLNRQSQWLRKIPLFRIDP